MHHDHEYDHAHEGGDVTPGQRARALLAYMIDHNDHHADELSALLDAVSGPAHRKLHEAIGSFEVANTQLREVLALLDEQEG